MSELERNLATFQNLCVIASVDGKIGEGEMTLLADTALSMGLPPGEFWAKILRAPFLDFIIPDTEEERFTLRQEKPIHKITPTLNRDGGHSQHLIVCFIHVLMPQHSERFFLTEDR